MAGRHLAAVLVLVLSGGVLAPTAALLARQWDSSRQREIEEAQARRQREIQEAYERRQKEIQEANERRQREIEEANRRRQQEIQEANQRRQAELQQRDEARRRERKEREQAREAERKKAEDERLAKEAKANEQKRIVEDSQENLRRLEAQLRAEGKPVKLCAVLLDGFRYVAPFAGDLTNAKRVFELGFDDDDVLPVLLHEGPWLKVDHPGFGAGWVPVSRADVFPALPSGYCTEGGLGDGRYLTVASGTFYRGPTKRFGLTSRTYKAGKFLDYPEGTVDWVGDGLGLRDWMPREHVVFVPHAGYTIAAQSRVANLKVYGTASTEGPTVFTIRDEGAYLIVYGFVEASRMFQITPPNAPRAGFVPAQLVRDRREWNVDPAAAAHYLNYFAPPPPPRPQRAQPKPPSLPGCATVFVLLGLLYLAIRYRATVWPVVRAAVLGPSVFLYDLYDTRRRRSGAAASTSLLILALWIVLYFAALAWRAKSSGHTMSAYFLGGLANWRWDEPHTRAALSLGWKLAALYAWMLIPVCVTHYRALDTGDSFFGLRWLRDAPSVARLIGIGALSIGVLLLLSAAVFVL